MWTSQHIPSQQGKTALITGGNSGIGFEAALALREKGADIIITGHNAEKTANAAKVLLASPGTGKVWHAILHLEDYDQVRQFAADLQTQHKRLDILINNAGVMMPPPSTTKDGHELQFGVNVLGPFLLTALVFPLLQQSPAARIVSVSSGANIWAANIPYDNLKLEQAYTATQEYGVSKLGDLLFAFELDRRLQKAGSNILSVAAHPGIVQTELQRHIPADVLTEALKQYKEVMQPWQGALPLLYAATDSAVEGGGYYGPDGEEELTGYPAPAHKLSPAARNETAGAELWAYAEKATATRFQPGA